MWIKKYQAFSDLVCSLLLREFNSALNLQHFLRVHYLPLNCYFLKNRKTTFKQNFHASRKMAWCLNPLINWEPLIIFLVRRMTPVIDTRVTNPEVATADEALSILRYVLVNTCGTSARRRTLPSLNAQDICHFTKWQPRNEYHYCFITPPPQQKFWIQLLDCVQRLFPAALEYTMYKSCEIRYTYAFITDNPPTGNEPWVPLRRGISWLAGRLVECKGEFCFFEYLNEINNNAKTWSIEKLYDL